MWITGKNRLYFPLAHFREVTARDPEGMGRGRAVLSSPSQGESCSLSTAALCCQNKAAGRYQEAYDKLRCHSVLSQLQSSSQVVPRPCKAVDLSQAIKPELQIWAVRWRGVCGGKESYKDQHELSLK